MVKSCVVSLALAAVPAFLSGCGGGEDVSRLTWTKYAGKNAYEWEDHGAKNIDSDDMAPLGLSVEQCEARCIDDANCECVAFQPSNGRCWKRAACVPEKFDTNAEYDTYVISETTTRAPVISETTTGPSSGGDCLCIFDVDRTLTGSQGDVSNCPGNLVQQGVQDTAYGGGDLTLSQLAQALQSTFCSKCYIGSISQGDASGPDSVEQGILHDKLATGDKGGSVSPWKSGCAEIGALLTDCNDGDKQNGVPSIIQYYEESLGVRIAAKDVYFFDDKEVNIRSFEGTEYNAHQISCQKRDGDLGLCGAELSEIVETPGQALCGQANFFI